VVLAVGNDENKLLIAYFKGDHLLENTNIRKDLLQQLPDYMVPAKFIWMDEFPLTANGKTNRKALAAMEVALVSSNNYVSAKNELQAQLVSIWEDILSLDQVGIHDDFFEIGGHSLLATQIITRIKSQSINFLNFRI